MSLKQRKHHKRARKGFLSLLKAYISKNRLGELLVMHGFLSPYELKHALKVQKEKKIPLGQVLIQHSFISRRQLNSILVRQYALRTIAAGLFFFTSVSPAKRSYAETIKDVPARISLSAEANRHFANLQTYPALFETAEKRSSSLGAFTKWTDMFNRFDRELRDTRNSALVNDWRQKLAKFDGLSIKGMADKVNALVNETRYIVDSKNWGKSDYWATPVEFLKRGGDCEDFAIAKYTALRVLGVPEERMRVAIVHDKQKNIAHAILIVYAENGPYILDNQNKELVRADRVGRYKPIFSINRTAWWLHTSPKATIMASAK